MNPLWSLVRLDKENIEIRTNSFGKSLICIAIFPYLRPKFSKLLGNKWPLPLVVPSSGTDSLIITIYHLISPPTTCVKLNKNNCT